MNWTKLEKYAMIGGFFGRAHTLNSCRFFSTIALKNISYTHCIYFTHTEEYTSDNLNFGYWMIRVQKFGYPTCY